MALYFISDLHLQTERPELNRAFLSYLEQLPADAEALYILGDFFEVWVGDDDDTAWLTSIKTALKKTTDRGIACFIMHGNRDFLLGAQFCSSTGCQLISDPFILNYADRKYLLMHGDSLCTGDQAYMEFRQMVRSAQWQQQLLQQDLASRRQLAKQLRDTSMQANASKAEDIMDVTPSEVEAVMAQYDSCYLIHGHTHRPARHDLQVLGKPAQRWVLGDWDKLGWQIRIDSDGPELSRFPIDAG